MTETEALEAILVDHRELTEGLTQRVAALGKVVAEEGRYEPVAADLLAFLADKVLPYASAEEQTIYPAAQATPGLAAMVEEMRAEHRRFAALTEDLANAAGGSSAFEAASTAGSLFTAHVDREKEVILPRLQAEGVDLAELLGKLRDLIERGEQTDARAVRTADDTTNALLSLFLDLATDLASAGEGDRACRDVASAWAVLRGPRPDLAVRATAALHKLARSVATAPVGVLGAKGEAARPDRALDVRELAPAQRHEVIFTTYHGLAPGAAFVLVNDHDPKPLYYQFEAEHAGYFSWHYLEAGPTVWRVRIGRPRTGHPGDTPTVTAEAGDPEPELDVRHLPHGRRHDNIFATFEALAPGSGFVLVNDHDPKPLRYQFEAQHFAEYTWDYLEAGPNVWRVRIGRAVTSTPSDDEAS